MTLIDQRVMEPPGQGIVTPPAAIREHQEYPKHMRHPGYAPATIGEEVKSPHGFTYYRGGTAQRYPPVLVSSERDEQYHLAQGYETVGACTPEAFAKVVQLDTPTIEHHVAIEYPKWVQGKLVKSAEEEARVTGQPVQASSEAATAVPVVNTEINTLEPAPAPAESKEEKRARLLRELAELEEPAVAEPVATATEVAARKKAHAAKIKAGIAARKAKLADAAVKKAEAELPE